MHKGLILVSMLAMLLASNALCEITTVPASQNLYVSLGTGNEQVFNKTDILRCEINVTDFNGTKVKVYPGVPMIQFDISDLNMTENDVGILVLKAASIAKNGSNSAMVALLTIGSDWSEDSDLPELLLNVLPAWNIFNKNDLTLMSTNTDGDKIFAFDVSKKLLEAKAKGDQVSFLLEAISNSSYRVDFFSRESGQGPYLMVMPYPGRLMANQTATSNQSSSTNSSNSNESSKLNLVVPNNKTSAASQIPGTNKISTGNKVSGAKKISTMNATLMMPFNESPNSPLDKESQFKNAILQEMKNGNVQTTPIGDDEI
ncbi:MAG TPA: hypothetical protein VLY86_02365 [Methanothrix sp.]|nr:hypothetical protein [Methanothrix sp.]